MPNNTRSGAHSQEHATQYERDDPESTATTQRRNTSLILEMEEEDDEDEIALGVPIRPKKRRRLTQWHSEELRKEAVRIVNGTLTPVTDNEGRTGSYQDSAATSSDEDTNWIAPAQPKKLKCEVSDDEAARAEARKLFMHPSTSAYPHWMYRGSELEASPEHRAVRSLQIAFHEAYPPTRDVRPEYTYFTLDDFTVYQLPSIAWHANELVTLEKLTMARKSEFHFAGTLSFGNMRIFVKDIPFDVLTLEYGDDSRSWTDRICIQSRIAKDQQFYYKLGRPAVEYRRFYTPFLMLAQFTDYFIDYMCDHEDVTIAHFRSDFWSWLQAAHSDNAVFQAWHKRIQLLDFRTLLAVNVEFLWKECWDIDRQSANTSERTALCNNPLWGEVHPERLRAIPTQPVNYTGKTVVTPFAYACFQKMYFADMLGVPRIAEDGLRERVNTRKASLGLSPLCSESFPAQELIEAQPLRKVTDVRAGDVVAVPADKTGDWKLSNADFWYAYVQRIWKDRKDSRRLDVIWLYQPEDTTIGNAFYPYKQELFLSDNCGCGKQEALYLDDIEDVVGKAEVSWFVADPNSVQSGFFVRRTFRTVPELNQYDFVTLERHHFCCCHQDDYIDRSVVQYKIGDAVLVDKEQDNLGRNCEPAIIVDLSSEGGRDRVLLRRLGYAVRAEQDAKARPNELIVTDEEFLRPKDDIVRPCHIRIFDRDNVPTPYDRDGTGDYFFIARDSSTAELPLLNESWGPQNSSSKTKLTGLGIFCGGGTFDRGLEEGGAVQFRYAVDLAEKALYSYRANDPEPDRTAYYLGSVNEYLELAMMSRKCDLVAQPGTVDIISAGSPCQGFSRMQRDQQSDRSRQNASMVASVISYVDLYAPRYLVLENVVAMTNNVKGLGEQNVFSQMIAALVGLGYQVQQFLMDAYYYGSSQARSRVFIIATAPTCAVLEQPEYTHRRPAHLERRGNLGRCSNGKPFGSRREDAYTPFAQVSAEDSVMDLPIIHDGQPFLCPSHPDHRTATEETATNRTRMAVVPQRPFGMSLVQAAQAGLVRGEPLNFSYGKNQIKCGPGSKSFRRVFPDRPFPTILTKLSVGDGMNGQAVHWNQHRVLTIMECRRAQGYPDHEVLVGLSTERMKIVGNSVDRKVALVLGLAVRDSWLKSPPVDIVKVPVLIDESAVGMPPAGLVDAEGDHAEFDSDRTGISATPTSLPDEYDEAAAPAGEATYSSGKTWTSLNDSPIDNRSVKMALSLSEHDLQSIRIGGFKRINELLQSTARKSLQSGDGGHEG
ncbi:DNA (cytosine-5)-methyltransferase 1 [Cercospora beticola]|uniref:DNA (cytosine-5-)-methyltransferase n=1 Tax=Cercospora beticola TaxID=122368 RepID=A0A2G5HTK2_CERBT|nr:DNA (cytosine-5)-methyltransferase 1 [Cercospora beticola]PIA95855.1 DNA (cytosine-5)-methyltransferase 1 [Cercospora beticola]WPB07281.1 hypothetical protein RHO25_011942 [Cercospora beticola]